jgi:hypothetical protein
MSVPNIGPELPDPTSPEAMDNVRKGNPASAYRDDGPTDDVKAASIRASAASHRFGSARHTMSRPKNQQAGESDPGK